MKIYKTQQENEWPIKKLDEAQIALRAVEELAKRLGLEMTHYPSLGESTFNLSGEEGELRKLSSRSDELFARVQKLEEHLNIELCKGGEYKKKK